MRIISGSARGRKIEAPEGLDTRPTLDRVKEAVFGSLQFDLPGSTVLDLFSGSGNLGLEAASRGAAYVVFNDHARSCTEIIRRNIAHLALDVKTEVLQQDFREALAQLRNRGVRFDIALLDAPYADGTAQEAAAFLFENGMLKENGCAVIEHAWDRPPQEVPGVMRIRKQKKFGLCGYTIFERTPTA